MKSLKKLFNRQNDTNTTKRNVIFVDSGSFSTRDLKSLSIYASSVKSKLVNLDSYRTMYSYHPQWFNWLYHCDSYRTMIKNIINSNKNTVLVMDFYKAKPYQENLIYDITQDPTTMVYILYTFKKGDYQPKNVYINYLKDEYYNISLKECITNTLQEEFLDIVEE